MTDVARLLEMQSESRRNMAVMPPQWMLDAAWKWVVKEFDDGTRDIPALVRLAVEYAEVMECACTDLDIEVKAR